MPTNLGRVRGSFIYNGNAITDSAIKSELSAAGALVLDKDIYICNSSGNHPYFVYNASRDLWENKGTISGIDNFDSFLSLSSTNGVQNKVLSAFLNGKVSSGSFKATSTSPQSIVDIANLLTNLTTIKPMPSGLQNGVHTYCSGTLIIDTSRMSNLDSSRRINQMLLWKQDSGRYEPSAAAEISLHYPAILIMKVDWYVVMSSGYGTEYINARCIGLGTYDGGAVVINTGTARIRSSSPSVGTYGGRMYLSFYNDWATSHADDYLIDAIFISNEKIS